VESDGFGVEGQLWLLNEF
jgi:hypothetical protein